MGIKQKFFVLSGVVGLLLAIVSIIGYYTASTNLNASIEGEINYTVRAEAEELEGWLREKKASATYAASLMTGFKGDMARLKSIESLSSVADDKEILDLNIGMEDGYFASLHTGDGTGRMDPRTRPWYKDTKAAGKAIFTEAYVDKNTNKLVVSAAAPFKVNGAFGGALCTDVGLDVVTEQAKKIKYQKQGIGIIIEPTGKILASGGDHQQMSDFKSIPDIGARFDQMVQNKKGFFTYESKDGTNVFAYRTIPSTGWIIGLAVPYDFVYASLIRMRYTYTIAVVAGLVLVTFLCLQFASRITGPIIELEKDAKEMAAGNLRMPPIPVESSDEIGSLTGAFNEMQKNLKSLIGQMSSTSEQVASSSEELTAGAHQAAQAATNVAETVVEVASGMDKQLTNIDQAKQNVDAAFIDIQNMTEQAKEAAEDSERTKEAAEHGSTLMQDAMHRMEQIESSVMSSADVVKKLGENSKQIGQIVESISAIADQTNLLALNAAIEAARAGEAGRGFSVVAEEVRKLAEQSQQSAEEIKQRISVIQGDTADAVVSMESGTNEVQQGAQAIREVGEQFSEIMSMVTNIEAKMQGISGSVDKVSKNTQNIVLAVDDIDSVSRKTAEHTQTISAAAEEQSASSQEIASASQSLATLATDLQTAIGKFRI